MSNTSPGRPLFWRLALTIAIAILGVFAVWRAFQTDAAPEPTTAVRPTDSGDAQPAEPRGLLDARSGQSSRVIQVDVRLCRGVEASDVMVVVTHGDRVWQGPVAVAGTQASATIATAPDATPRTVTARWRTWTSEGVAVQGDSATLSACPGAELFGRVMTSRMVAHQGIPVELRDRGGEVIAKTITDSEGAYRLRDPDLTGVSVAVPTLEVPEVGRRAIVQLNPLEMREFHVLVGDTRAIVGWVLDVLGEPQAGVLVNLVWEDARVNGSQPSWKALTDGGGGFVFVDAPLGPVRANADGGLRGFATARVNDLAGPGGRSRREVSLVLEPSASLRVMMANAPDNARIVVHSAEPMAHGGITGLDVARPGGGSEIVSLAFMQRKLVPALARWDDSDVEASMIAVATAMLSYGSQDGIPMRYRQSDDEAAVVPDDDDGGATLEGIAGTAARRVIAEFPDMVSYFGRAAERLRGGMDSASALSMGLGAGVSPDPLFDPNNDSWGAEPSPRELSEATRAGLIKAFGVGAPSAAFSAAPEAWTEVAHGRLGEWLVVRPGIQWHVSLQVPGVDGTLDCGYALIAAGEMLELSCGATGEALVLGRLVDADGAPMAGVEVRGELGETVRSTADGKFQLRLEIDRAQTTHVWACTDCERSTGGGLVGGRRRVNLVPLGAVELGDIVMLPHAPNTGPQGEVSVRGGTFMPTATGFFIDAVAEGGWLENEGVTPGDSLVRVGAAEAGRLQSAELFRILQGDAPGVRGLQEALELWLRTSDGELYPLTAREPALPPK